MKFLSLSLCVCATLAASSASAQSNWRFSAGYAPMVGLRAEFSGFGNYNNPFPALPAPGPGQNYFYNDGSVQVDSSGNAGGLTTFFSYQNNSQYDPTANGGLGAINFNALASGFSGAGSVAESNIAAAGGFDVAAYRHMGSVAIPAAGGREASWGLRVAAQYNRIQVNNNDTLSTSLGTITDSFSTGGAIPPLAPYAGTFAGPGFLLGDTPTRTFGTTTAAISGSRSLDVHVFATQLGSYLEIPVAKKLDVMVEGGLVLAVATGSYRYDTNVAIPGYATQTTDGYANRTRFLPGFYTSVGLMYHITEKLGVQGAVRYQFMKEFDLGAGGSSASVAFNTAFTLSVSAVYKF